MGPRAARSLLEPITLGALNAEASTRAIPEPLAATSVRFDTAVVAEIVELSGGRPYYLQKLAYYAFDASEHGQVSEVQFAVDFVQAFASVSQEFFAARWSAIAVIERRVVSVVASSAEARSSGDIESAAAQHGVRPDATRQALRRLVARGESSAMHMGSVAATSCTIGCSAATWSGRVEVAGAAAVWLRSTAPSARTSYVRPFWRHAAASTSPFRS